MHPRNLIACSGIGIICLLNVACSDQKPEASAEYQAVCHGIPLKTVEARQRAQEDGYHINETFNCIDQASFEAVQRHYAELAAANTLEKIAQRNAAREQRLAQDKAAQANEILTRRAQADTSSNTPFTVHPVEINTASEAELASMPGVGPDTARTIIQERTNSPFESWPDVVHRIIGLSAAQNVVYASSGGLMVNGESFNGAPPDQQVVDTILKKR